VQVFLVCPRPKNLVHDGLESSDKVGPWEEAGLEARRRDFEFGELETKVSWKSAFFELP